jgi:hypothetical protein
MLADWLTEGETNMATLAGFMIDSEEDTAQPLLRYGQARRAP